MGPQPFIKFKTGTAPQSVPDKNWLKQMLMLAHVSKRLYGQRPTGYPNTEIINKRTYLLEIFDSDNDNSDTQKWITTKLEIIDYK